MSNEHANAVFDVEGTDFQALLEVMWKDKVTPVGCTKRAVKDKGRASNSRLDFLLGSLAHAITLRILCDKWIRFIPMNDQESCFS
jgi:hypothetical protein